MDLLAVQGTLKSLLQHHSSKASILLRSAFFTVQVSHPYVTTGKAIALTRQETWSSGWFPREEGALGWRVWQGRFSRTELARMGFLLNVCLVLWACEGPWGLLLGFLLMFSEP